MIAIRRICFLEREERKHCLLALQAKEQEEEEDQDAEQLGELPTRW